MNATPLNCINCGYPVSNKYCGNCGEKIFTDHDKSFGHILHESFHFLTHLDGKLLTSLRALTTRPGQLAYDFCRGVQKKYFRPVSLFFFVVVVYLVFPFTQGLNLSMKTTVASFDSHSMHWAKKAVDAKAFSEGISVEQLAQHYDQKSPKFAKIMLFLLLPMAAFILWILFRARHRYFFDHFIFATELVTGFILVTFLCIPALLSLVSLVLKQSTGRAFIFGDEWMVPLMAAILIPLWTIAFKRFYQEKTMWAILKAVLFIAVFTLLCLFIIYRLIIFFTILLFL